jgi:hypothetical protein
MPCKARAEISLLRGNTFIQDTRYKSPGASSVDEFSQLAIYNPEHVGMIKYHDIF